jgi:hypothetical protein
METSLDSVSGEIETRRKQRELLEIELGRLAGAVAVQGATTAHMKAISDRQFERNEVEPK